MESSLGLAFDDISARVGRFLGYGAGDKFGETTWGASQQFDIYNFVKSGHRSFYFPPRLPGEQTTYAWSFMRPTTSVTLAANTSVIAMPDDFGGIDGQFNMGASNSVISLPMPLVGEGLVRQRHSELPHSTGQPIMAAIQPIKGTTLTKGQRFQLYVWPTADQAYTVEFTYYLLPDALTEDRPYAYGGAAHAETLVESCLAIAEQNSDDTMGVHTEKFMERLAASISYDRKMKAQVIGYNSDLGIYKRSGGMYRGRWPNESVTVYGQNP